MKKILLSAVAVLAFSFANAQELVSSKGENYLPKQGDWSIGFNANSALSFIGNSFNNSTNNSVNFNSNDAPGIPGFSNSVSFVGKRLTTDNTADRYTANFLVDVSKPKDKEAQPKLGLLVGYGKEWRKGTTRLQGFYGADAFLGLGSTTAKTFDSDNKVVTVTSGLGFGIGAQGFVGAEYFIFPKVALGAQYTYGVSISYISSKTENKVSNTSTDDNTFNFNLGGVGTASVLLNLYF